MAKADLGTKRICPTTGKKFYDLNKNPVISPYSGEIVPIAVAPPPRTRADAAARASAAAAAATAAAAAPEPAEAEELVSLEEADAEENTGKVKAQMPESEDDIEVDETLDDDDDDSTFIPEEEEDDEDVTDIIGDVSGDEET
ncbi:MAG: TIGR02300 family protein [Afipia sp.]|nr:TIGR02300 family protein [Afipia sp.]